MLPIIEFLGILTFALSGIIEARRKRMDLVGVYTYATAAFAGCMLYGVLLRLGLGEGLAVPAGIAAVVLIRLAALRLNLRLPGGD